MANHKWNKMLITLWNHSFYMLPKDAALTPKRPFCLLLRRQW